MSSNLCLSTKCIEFVNRSYKKQKKPRESYNQINKSNTISYMKKTWQTIKKINENTQLPGLQTTESAAELFSLMKPKLIIKEIGELY